MKRGYKYRTLTECELVLHSQKRGTANIHTANTRANRLFITSGWSRLKTTAIYINTLHGTGLSVGAAGITGQDRSMWRMLWPSAGQAQQWVSECTATINVMLWHSATQQQSTAPQSGHAQLTQVWSMCSWTPPCVSEYCTAVWSRSAHTSLVDV